MLASIPANEHARLKEIECLCVYDLANDTNLTALVEMLAVFVKVPICAITIIDRDEQRFLVSVGLDTCQTSRDVSFCAHILAQPTDLLVIPDATRDERFADNPLVTGPLNIRAYAGAPIFGEDGIILGALCLIDTKPRKFTKDQLSAISTVSREVTNRLRQRSSLLELFQTRQELESSEQLRQETNEQLATLLQSTEVGRWEVRMPDFQLKLDDSYLSILGYGPGELEVSYDAWLELLHPQDADGFQEKFRQHYSGEVAFAEAEFRLKAKDGHYVWCLARGKIMEFDANGNPSLLKGIMQDHSRSKQMQESLAASENRLRTAQKIAKVGSWEFDLSTQEIWWSAETFRIFELDPADGCPSFEKLLELHHPDDRHQLAEAVQNAATTGEVYELCLRIEVNGSTKHLVAVGEAILDEDGGVRKLVGVVQDISIQRKLEINTREREEYLNRVTTAIPDVVFTHSLTEAASAFSNRDFATFLGYQHDQLSGSEVMQTFAHPADYARFQRRMGQLEKMSEGTTLDSEVRMMHADGSWRMILMRITGFQRTDSGELESLLILGRDVTVQHKLEEVAAEQLVRSQVVHEELKKRERQLLRAKQELENQHVELACANLQLEEQAMTDGLTGIANRHALREKLKEMTTAYKGSGNPLSVVILDLDHFKKFNDTYGHIAGDQALRVAADLFRETIRPEDFVARYGGEEFVLLLPNTDEFAAKIVMGRIQARTKLIQWPHEQVTISQGASTTSRGTVRPEQLIELADEALYRSKSGGRDQFHHYADLLTSEEVA